MPEYLSVCTVQIDNVCVCVCKRERERVSRSYCSGILVDFHALSFSRITKKKNENIPHALFDNSTVVKIQTYKSNKHAAIPTYNLFVRSYDKYKKKI